MSQHIQKWTAKVFVSAVLLFGLVGASGQTRTQLTNGSPAPSVPVLVTNGSDRPVPTAAQGTTNVAGTVNIGNTPNVSVANTPNVNVANTASVTVANTPTVNLAAGGSVNVTNPLNSQNNPSPLAVLEATQPYEDYCAADFQGANFASCSFHAVPSGKRLVIQEFDAGVSIETGLKLDEIVFQSSLGAPHFFTATLMGQLGPGDEFATHQETRLYVQSGAPTCTIILNTNSNGNYLCSFSGFLVDVP